MCLQQLIKHPSAPVNTEVFCSRALECEDDDGEEDEETRRLIGHRGFSAPPGITVPEVRPPEGKCLCPAISGTKNLQERHNRCRH